MYFADLSPYEHHLRGANWPNVLNIGWLNAEEPYETVLTVETGFIPKLLEVIAGSPSFDARVGLRRGVRPCGLCGLSPVIVRNGGSDVYLGRCQIWVPFAEHPVRYFAAPDLVFHYVERHGYSPPRTFIESVMSVDLTMRYNAQREYKVMGFWHHRFEEAHDRSQP